MNIFQQAAQVKLRFTSPRGPLAVEDLYDLPLKTTKNNGMCLNDVAITVHNELKNNAEISFVEEIAPVDAVNQLRMEILKTIIAEKKAENVAKKAAMDKAAKKQKLLALIADKQDEELKGKSLADLTAMLNDL